MKFYDFKARKMNGQEVSMNEYEGKVILVVNTASKCGLTPQFKELQEIYFYIINQTFLIKYLVEILKKVNLLHLLNTLNIYFPVLLLYLLLIICLFL